MIREFVKYIDGEVKLDDDFIKGLHLRAQLLTEYYARYYLNEKVGTESQIWVPDEEIQRASKFTSSIFP